MDFDRKDLAEKLAEMKPEERVTYLEALEKDAKKKMQEMELVLKESEALKKKNKERMLREAIAQGEQFLRDRIAREQLERERKELSALLEQEGSALEDQIRSTRLPASHPVVGLYSQLRGIQYSYKDDSAIDYARTTILPEIRDELVAVLSQYQEVPTAMKEIADVAYRLTKELLGERAAEAKKYFAP